MQDDLTLTSDYNVWSADDSLDHWTEDETEARRIAVEYKERTGKQVIITRYPTRIDKDVFVYTDTSGGGERLD